MRLQRLVLLSTRKNYESMSTTVDNKEIKYRAFEYIPYVANPIDIDQQYMNILCTRGIFQQRHNQWLQYPNSPYLHAKCSRWLHAEPGYDA